MRDRHGGHAHGDDRYVNFRWAKLWRWLAATVAAMAIVSALGVGAFRLALGLLPEYEARVADMVREATGLRLSFDSLDARLGLRGPEIHFQGARIVDPQGEVLVTAREGAASLALLRSAWFRRLEVGRVVLESPQLHLVIFPDRHIELVGQAGFAGSTAPRQPAGGLERVPRGTFEVRDASLSFLDLRAGHTTWELTRANIEMRRQGGSISLKGTVSLPKHLGQSLDVDADVSGDLADFGALSWRGKVQARDVDFAGWADVLPENFRVPMAGTGSFSVSARGKGARLERGRAQVQLKDVELPHATGATPVVYERLAGELEARRTGDGWQLSGRKLEFSLPGSRWSPSDLDATLVVTEQRLAKASLRTGFFRIQNLLPLLVFTPQTPLRDRIETLAPRGTLRRVELAVSPAADGQMPDVTGKAEFEDLGYSPLGRVPGVTGLDGSFEGKGPVSVLHLATTGLAVDWPGVWRSRVELTGLRAVVELSRALGGLRVAADDVMLDADHGAATGRLRLLARPGETPLMDIKAHAMVSDLSAVPKYLPMDRLSPAALAWLDAAFSVGRVTSSDVEITGPAMGFPYRDGQGRFHIVAQVEGASLHYAPGWPQVTDAIATVVFDGASMKVTADSARAGGIETHDATAEIPDLRDSILLVRAAATADAGKVHEFFTATPLAPSLGSLFARLSASGPISGELVMYLPIKHFDDHVVTVHGMAEGVDATLQGFGGKATNARGEFWVRNREFFAPSLEAGFLGGTAVAHVTSRSAANGDVTTTIDASGSLQAERLADVARLPDNAGLTGATAWRGSWQLQRPEDPAGTVVSRVHLESELDGLVSGLPAPLAKPAATPLHFSLDMDLQGGDSALARVSLGRSARALFELRRIDDALQLTRGVVRFGGADASALPVGPGLRIDGRLPYLSISDLTNLQWSRAPERHLQDLLADVQLDVGRLEVLGHQFDGVTGRMRPGNKAWTIEVSADTARGSLQVPYEFPGEVPLVADLDKLVVASATREPGEDADPRRLPAMRVDVRDLKFLDWKLGHLAARLEHQADGLSLESFSVQQPAFTSSGSGSWRIAPGGTLASLKLDVDSTDVKGMLQALAIAPAIEASKAHLEAEVDWPGGIDAEILARISGKAKVVLADGRMLALQPGAGRILGLMSLSHIGRRLLFDFGDVTGEGMAFDSIKGDFSLASGEAFTDNLTLRGPAAEIGIAGRTSLRDRSYDQTAVVTGDLGASLGVAGAIAGGPAVGAALLLFSQIFKEPLKGVARAYYRITGPWDEPVVKKIDAQELEEQAARMRALPTGDASKTGDR
jgi:uncharacterized protein (TIGR02099 family)